MNLARHSRFQLPPRSRACCPRAASSCSPPPSSASAPPRSSSPPVSNLTHGYPAALAQNLTEQAHKLQAPIGFADIVEKVKPAVISVRVKVDGGSQTTGLGNNEIPPGLREFFRRFGMPDVPDSPRSLPRGPRS